MLFCLLIPPEVFGLIPIAFWKRPVFQSFTFHIPFTAGTESSYTISDTSQVEFVGGVARLKPISQTDNSTNTGASSGGFLDGTLSGVQWDSSRQILRLNTTTNTSEFDASWAPKWSDIVAYWKLNGSGSIATSASIAATVGTDGVANNGGSFSYAAAKLNEGISFAAGLNRFSATTSLAISNTYTVSFWVKLSSFPATISAPISATSSGSAVWQIHFNNTDTTNGAATYAIYARSGSSYSASAANTFVSTDLGTWHHIVVTYDSAASPKTQIYKNGVKLAMSLDNITGNFPTHDTLWVGGRRGDNSTSADSNGSLDELAIWSQALTESEVSAIYGRQSAKYSGQLASRIIDATASASWTSLALITKLPFFKELPTSANTEASSAYSSVAGGLTTGLTNYWRLNENTGTSVGDSVGSITGTWLGTLGKQWTAGPFRTGGTFNGSDNRISTTNTTILTNNKFSVSFWVKVNQFPSPTNVASCAVCKGFTIFGPTTSYQGSTNTFSVGIQKTSSGNVLATSTTSNYPSGVWHHYTAVYDGTQSTDATRLKLYINGVAQTLSFDSTVPTTAYVQTDTLSIGRHPSAYGGYKHFDGSLDEIAIWGSTALTSTEVLEIYRRGANRAKYQIRTCANADCSDQEALTSAGKGWKGPDNTQVTYFSELYNTTSNTLGSMPLGTSPVMTFSNFSGSGLSVTSNRYVQYRAILESDDANSLCNYGSAASCSPEVQAVSIGPTHYTPNAPSVTSNASLGSVYMLLDTAGFIATLGGNSCSGEARYSLSSDGTNFYYWDGSTWAASTGWATANDSLTLGLNVSSFHLSPAGVGGPLQVRTFLKSDGTTQCEVDNIQINGAKM